MDPAETMLEMATRHVAEGERHVAHQKAIVAELRDHGYPTRTAVGTLHETPRLRLSFRLRFRLDQLRAKNLAAVAQVAAARLASSEASPRRPKAAARNITAAA